MPKVSYIKTSFSGGEFGSSLWGRTDVAQYENACEIVENMLVRPYGSAISTPGTWFINEVKTSAKRTRLIPFIFNRADSYVIEAGEEYFRFYTDRGIVITTGTTPFELAHIYDENEIFDVQFAQLNDVVWLTHPDHPPQKLIRYTAEYWTIADFAFVGGPFMDDNTTSTQMSCDNDTGTINVTTSSAVFTVSGSTLGHHDTYWKFGGTQTNSTTGVDEQGYFKISYVTDGTNATASVIKLLTDTTGTTAWAEGAWSDVRGWPARVAFHEARLFFARTDDEPDKIWGSKSFVFDDFALDGGADDDGLNLQLATNESNEIQWLASGTALIAGTYGGEFTISGGADEALTPSTAFAKKQASWGSEAIVPKRIGNFFYYVQRFGLRLRELFYSWDVDTYKAVDKTIFSPGVLESGVIDMAYQQTPDTILWCVLSNGTIATLTREVDQEIQGWSRQETDGLFESIAVIPSQTYQHDEVWVVVKRTIDGAAERYVEVFENIEVPDLQDECLYVHSALQFSAYDDTTDSSATLTLSGTDGTITLSTGTAYFAAGDVGNRVRAIDSDGVTVGEAKVTSYSSTTLVTGDVKYAFDGLTYAAGLWGISASELSGFDHLEAKELAILGDGGTDKPNQTVSEGTLTLSNDYFKVNAGLPYTQKLLTLPMEAGSARGTAQGKIQKINEVAVKVNRSHKGFKIGGDEDLAERINFRDPTTLMGTPELLFTGIIPNITFRDDYRYGSQVMVINEDPLPIEILSIITELTTQDK